MTSSIIAHEPLPLNGFISIVGNAPTQRVSKPNAPTPVSTHDVNTLSAPEA